MTTAQRSSYLVLLTRELRLSHLGWILDDAVTGAGIFYELLGDYGLSPEAPEHRAILREAIDANLSEGW